MGAREIVHWFRHLSYMQLTRVQELALHTDPSKNKEKAKEKWSWFSRLERQFGPTEGRTGVSGEGLGYRLGMWGQDNRGS